VLIVFGYRSASQVYRTDKLDASVRLMKNEHYVQELQ